LQSPEAWAPLTFSLLLFQDPAVKAEKGFSDIQRCQQLQKELLLAAIDSCSANAPGGGIVVYSTCSIAVEENEFIVE
jgi:ribosomal RNA methyltransferase Nop2